MQRTEDDVRRVVEIEVAVQDPARGFHLAEERRPRIRREDVEGRALDVVLLDPADGAIEDVAAIVVEAEDEARRDRDAVVVEHADAARVVGGARRALAERVLSIGTVAQQSPPAKEENPGAAV